MAAACRAELWHESFNTRLLVESNPGMNGKGLQVGIKHQPNNSGSVGEARQTFCLCL